MGSIVGAVDDAGRERDDECAVLFRRVEAGRPPAGDVVTQTLTLSAIYVATATAIHALIVMLASSVRGLVARSGQIKTVRRLLALALVGVAIWLAWATAA